MRMCVLAVLLKEGEPTLRFSLEREGEPITAQHLGHMLRMTSPRLKGANFFVRRAGAVIASGFFSAVETGPGPGPHIVWRSGDSEQFTPDIGYAHCLDPTLFQAGDELQIVFEHKHESEYFLKMLWKDMTGLS